MSISSTSRRAVLLLGSLLIGTLAWADQPMKLWNPSLSLVKEGNGSYTLVASTLVPNPCYVSNGSVNAPPPGRVTTPETISVQLLFKRLGGIFCIEMPVTAIHKVTGIKFSQGSNSLVAFAVTGNEVKGSAGISPGSAMTSQQMAESGGGGSEVPTPFSIQPGGTCGGIQGKVCSDGSFTCDLPAHLCKSADVAGICKKRPEVCLQIFLPVCGCDGKTYSNDCFRLAAAASKDHDGACADSRSLYGE